VQDALTQRIVAEIIALDLRLSPEVSRRLAEGFVAQLPDSSISEEALQRAHALLRRLVRGEAITAEDEAIILDLRPVVERVVAALNLQLPAADRIQLPPDAGQVVLVQETDLTLAFRLARLFDAAAIYIAVLPLLAFALALLVAPNRLLALAACGAAVASTAGLRIALADGPLASRLVDAALLEPAARRAALDTYDTVAATFVQQEFVVLVVGLAVTIGALFLATVQAFKVVAFDSAHSEVR
jgi:hypothetical protein